MKKTDLRIKASFYEVLANTVKQIEDIQGYYLQEEGREPTIEDSRSDYYYYQAYKILIKKLEELEP